MVERAEIFELDMSLCLTLSPLGALYYINPHSWVLFDGRFRLDLKIILGPKQAEAVLVWFRVSVNERYNVNRLEI